jgi:biotin-(acetyl-CoA carboxylase) ligase
MLAEAPAFPPLMRGESVTQDPFEAAQARAALGCDAGTVVHNLQVDRLRAAIVFAPDVALEDAMAMLPLCGVAFQNAMGALAPPEVAVHLEWSGAIRVNGAGCGRLRASASGEDPGAVPDWLVIGLDLPILMTAIDPGDTPDVTALHEEGCADVAPLALLESWARHVLNWIHRWEETGNAPLHTDWMALAHGVGEDIVIADRAGTYLGVDERFGMLLRDSATTHLVPLSMVLEGTT